MAQHIVPFFCQRKIYNSSYGEMWAKLRLVFLSTDTGDFLPNVKPGTVR